MSAGRRNGRGPAIDLTIWGISDPEILGIVHDQADEDGWTHTIDVRLALGENVEEVGHRSGVGPKLAWLRRYEWLEQHPDDRSRWRLTPIGNSILDHPDLSAAVERALERMNPAQRVRLTRELAEGQAPAPIRTALRRQWTRSFGR